jgi:hypothetical protein
LASETARAYGRVIVICLPGDTPVASCVGNAHQYIARGPIDAAEIISHAFGNPKDIVNLEATDFYSQHPSGCDNAVRTAFAALFFSLLAQRPYTLGDDIIDGLQGAYHVAMSAHHLIGAPTPDELPQLSCPVIGIASGPSLTKHLPALRDLQHKCLLICADTALDGLIKAGITPHIVTPLERVPQVVDESFTAAAYPGVIFAGTPAVHQAIAEKFDRHILIPGSDVLFLWMGARQEQLFFYGQSTGVLSATVGTRLTTGPVYLVGHDLAFNNSASHWSAVHAGVQLGDEVLRVDVPGNNGGTVQSQCWWQIFLQEIAELAKATGRIVNVNGVTGDGAAIPHTISMALPDPATLPDFELPAWPATNHARMERLAVLLRRLPSDVMRVLAKLSSASLTMADIDFRTLCTSDNRLMLGYICRSAMGQFSMQHVAGRADRETAMDFSDAVGNSVSELRSLDPRRAGGFAASNSDTEFATWVAH